MNYILRIFNSRSLKVALPWLFLLVGFGCFFHGTFSEFDNPKWKDFWIGSGKSIIAGGIVSVFVKLMQDLGMIKDELTKVIFDPQYISNRNDLPDYWEKVSKELFKNTFPEISAHITKDVKEVYLPTQTMQYYDDVRHVIDIELIDPINEIVRVKDTVKMYLHLKEGSHPHGYRNKIQCPQNDPDTKLSITSFKVNGDEYVNSSAKNFTFNQEWIDGHLTTAYEIKLDGGKVYDVEKVIDKIYSLKTDNVIFLRNDCMRNNVNIQIFYKGISINFHDIGTLRGFETILERRGYLEARYNGIIYPKQGYLAIMKKET